MTTELSDIGGHPFTRRHIGPNDKEVDKILKTLGFSSLEEFSNAIIPDEIKRKNPINVPKAATEDEALKEIGNIAAKNDTFRSFIGMGYYKTITPSVILRNIFENPAWYTSYTPYQPEISQGRLEMLMNFQSIISDLTGFSIANASMLDEATAASEAMTFCKRTAKSKKNAFFVSKNCFPQTISVIKTRAKPLDIEVIVGDEFSDLDPKEVFGAIVQYPDANGNIDDFKNIANALHEEKAKFAVVADLLSLTLLTPPAEFGADVAVGNSQRFGVPVGFGGPHAGYMAASEKDKRDLPGRIVGASIDSKGKLAYRLALQTREQHIRRERASSNICTAQALLASMVGAYGVYHGGNGVLAIATNIHKKTCQLQEALFSAGLTTNDTFFDTLTIEVSEKENILKRATDKKINLRLFDDNRLGLSIDEATTYSELEDLYFIFTGKEMVFSGDISISKIPSSLKRKRTFLTAEVFNKHRSETEMMRYLRKLADFDLALDRTMIPLGSCTMKLNAVSELMPVSDTRFNQPHPFAPMEQNKGYQELFSNLSDWLCDITGYDDFSLQPNSGAQGEYAGLLTIKAYQESIGQGHRNICLIPQSAHGTNPASSTLAGMKVVVVKTDENGNVDLKDLEEKAKKHSDNLSATMITYPSTHGVFEENVRKLCDIIHEHGGQVYLDGANLAAQVGLAAPGLYGADVSHLNLHKTFAIPHGGGGPGVGPIGVKSHLAPFLPNHDVVTLDKKGDAVSAAPFGSASVLPITWMYIRMMGGDGLKKSSQVAVLNANYIAKKLSEHYDILYTDKKGLVAHECIVDIRPFKEFGISVDDVAKRLMDFGFHAPTMSFPVAGTLMIEPTESENLKELDRFCNAMINIREDIRKIEKGELPKDDNPLVNAPHTLDDLVSEWKHPYTREEAIFPEKYLKDAKYFTPVNRVDDAYGDKNLICTCPLPSAYE